MSSNIQLHEGHSPVIRLPLILNVNLCSVLEHLSIINCALQFYKRKPPPSSIHYLGNINFSAKHFDKIELVVIFMWFSLVNR